jgi:hypothetical protein
MRFDFTTYVVENAYLCEISRTTGCTEPASPNAQAVERIRRYEPMLHRQLNRAMDQLERLQRRRRGEAVPPPVNAHLSLEA